jgi:hypothetical protein
MCMSVCLCISVCVHGFSLSDLLLTGLIVGYSLPSLQASSRLFYHCANNNDIAFCIDDGS